MSTTEPRSFSSAGDESDARLRALRSFYAEREGILVGAYQNGQHSRLEIAADATLAIAGDRNAAQRIATLEAIDARNAITVRNAVIDAQDSWPEDLPDITELVRAYGRWQGLNMVIESAAADVDAALFNTISAADERSQALMDYRAVPSWRDHYRTIASFRAVQLEQIAASSDGAFAPSQPTDARTKVPITIDGNLTEDPDYGVSDNGTKWARFSVAVNDRQFNNESKSWENVGEPKFHRTTVFGRQAENVRDSLKKGNSVIVTGDLEFRTWTDKTSGEQREGTQIVATAVGPSLRHNTATVNRPEAVSAGPKADGSDVSATGPVAQPAVASALGVAR